MQLTVDVLSEGLLFLKVIEIALNKSVHDILYAIHRQWP